MNPPAWRRTTYVVAATQLFVLTGFGLALPFLPLYIQELGVSDPTSVAWWTGVMSAASGFTMAVATPIWGAIGDRFGWKRMLLRAITGGGLVLISMGLVANVPPGAAFPSGRAVGDRRRRRDVGGDAVAA
ncbi:MAG: multidrug efflux MFS transporter [Chloroflexi bacterium]|nr:MAG: multidrug efflux MFS transporter [Chloroflexota bacterium]